MYAKNFSENQAYIRLKHFIAIIFWKNVTSLKRQKHSTIQSPHKRYVNNQEWDICTFYFNRNPASTSKAMPVMAEDFGELKNKTLSATSSGSTILFIT